MWSGEITVGVRLQITHVCYLGRSAQDCSVHSRMWVEFISPACGSVSSQKYSRDLDCVSVSNVHLYVG